jgi:FKBP-type peptidyl-prolyl cis-trans isomerase (trigger factor)
MQFQLILKKDQIASMRQKIIEDTAKTMKLKGFRTGKAPKNMVEKQLDETKVSQEIINQLLPQVYQTHISKSHLKPIGLPDVKAVSTKPNEDWIFNITIAHPPQVKLGDYKTKLKKLTINSIDKKSNQEDVVLANIFEILLKTAACQAPELLVRQEVNRRLSQLIEQVDKLSLTLDDYLQSINRTSEQLKSDYEKIATDRLRLEFILDEITKTEKLQVSDKEVDALIDKIEDRKAANKLAKDPTELDSLRFSLSRQKTLEYLKSLLPSTKSPKKPAKN